MKKRVYVVRDRLVGFLSPIVDENDNTAMRNFERAMLTEQKDTPRMIEDFSLYFIGTFDTADGRFESIIPELVILGTEVKEKYEL